MASKPDRFYTDEQRAFLESFIPGHMTAETIEAFHERFGILLKSQQVRSFASYRGIKSGVHPTRWMKGRHNANELPLGGETVDDAGYVHVKVSGERNIHKRDRYRLKHYLVWESANGMPVPDGYCVLFADGNKRNFEPGNLVAVERRMLNVMTGWRMKWHDAESLRACMAIAQVRMALKSKRKEIKEATT